MNKTKKGQTNIKARLPCLCFRASDFDAPFQGNYWPVIHEPSNPLGYRFHHVVNSCLQPW